MGKNFNEEESEPSLGFMGQNEIYALKCDKWLTWTQTGEKWPVANL